MKEISNMYNKLNANLADFDKESNPGDYWYDCVILDAIGILGQFTDNDWHILLKELPGKSILWKKRLIECLGGSSNLHELYVILYVINTNDEDLFITCIDSLRSLDLSDLDNIKKEQLVSRIEILLEKSSSPVKLVLDDFIKIIK